ncbi:MAG: GGDEF domain-containing protein [Cocleimonas sp.]|nr:GGDEF domain-containing protein [Cocleimonas sp.]
MKKSVNNAEEDHQAYQSDKAYQAYLEPTKIKSFRFFCVLGAALYFVFIFADMYSLSIKVTDALMIRGATVLMLLGAFSLSYRNNFIKYYGLIVTATFLLGSLGILVMIYLAQPNDHASDVYFAGIMLMTMGLLSWSYLSIVTTTFILIAIIIGYVAAIGLSKEIPWFEVMVSLLFFTATIVIGMASKILQTRYLKEIFTLKESVAKSLKEKTEESNNNAFRANHDALTGLPNRRYAIHLLEGSLESAKKETKVLAILFMDLNGLKQINDLHGYVVGDAVLKLIAQRLRYIARKGNCLARMGGAEFLVGILLDKENLSDVDDMLDIYLQAITKPMKVLDKEFKLSASIGVASYPAHGSSVGILMKVADKKMCQARHDNELAGNSSDDLGSLVMAFKA